VEQEAVVAAVAVAVAVAAVNHPHPEARLIAGFFTRVHCRRRKRQGRNVATAAVCRKSINRDGRLADLGARHMLLREGIGWGNMPTYMVEEDPPDPAASWLIERFIQQVNEVRSERTSAFVRKIRS